MTVISSVGVVGGGTAGYLAALALKRRFPALRVVLIESKDVPIIGVGEATTPLLLTFLHAELGLDVERLFAAVRPTFKLGIRFEWGPPGASFSYPFGDCDPVAAMTFDGDLRDQSLTSLLLEAHRAPLLRGPEGEVVSMLAETKLAYHLDNAPFVRFLAEAAASAGIEHLEMTVDAVPLTGDEEARRTVRGLRGRDGREVSFDLYVDASGFRSLLMGSALESPFESYADSLFCDRALVAPMAQVGDELPPCTGAETMDAGWCWRIPMRHEDHRGYVYSSAHLSDAGALAEMRAKNPRMGDARLVSFRSGRHRDFWRGNVVAIGNAYGFVEPLESTALHMVVVEVGYLLRGIEDHAQAEGASAAVGAHWDYLRWFLALHYRFNRRLDTPFWRDARARVDISGLADVVDRYRREGPWRAGRDESFVAADPSFGLNGIMTLLLGQQVETSGAARGLPDEAGWRARVDRQRTGARWAVPHREALRLLDAQPELLRQLVQSPRSWLHDGTEIPRS